MQWEFSVRTSSLRTEIRSQDLLKRKQPFSPLGSYVLCCFTDENPMHRSVVCSITIIINNNNITAIIIVVSADSRISQSVQRKGFRLNVWISIPGEGNNCLFSTISRPVLRPGQFLIQWVPRPKRLRREIDHSSASSAPPPTSSLHSA
jgi:hypothetical protein